MCVCVIQYRLKREFVFSQKEKVKRMCKIDVTICLEFSAKKHVAVCCIVTCTHF